MNKLIVPILALFILAGCNSGTQTPDSIAYKTVASITTTVDSARQAWNNYVAGGHATVAQVTAVAQAYVSYQQAVAVAQVAITSYKTNADVNNLNKAIAALSDSSTVILQLITTLTTPTTH